MKKLSYIKAVLLQAGILATILLLSACGNNQDRKDTKDLAEERNEENFDDRDKKKDAQFLVNASEINLKHIQLGQLAQRKGMTTEVKELGKMMEDAHTTSQRDLTALAQRKAITIPTSPTNSAIKAFNDLNEKSGKDFDKAYANLMVKGNRDAISTYEKAAKDGNDRDIKTWAGTKLQSMRTHLNHSIDCQKKFAEMHLEKNR